MSAGLAKVDRMRLSRSTVKIERPRHLLAELPAEASTDTATTPALPLETLLARSLETGDAGPLQAALAQTPAAEVESFLSSVDGRRRRDVEKLLAQVTQRLVEAPAGRRVHDVRASRQQPWWGAVKADPLPAPLHLEPTKDIDVHGERFSKDDVASLLRTIAR